MRERTGLVLDPYFSGTKAEWLLANRDIPIDDDLAIGTIDAWLIWNLTGGAVFATAPTISAPVLAGTTDLSGGQLKFPATQSASTDDKITSVRVPNACVQLNVSPSIFSVASAGVNFDTATISRMQKKNTITLKFRKLNSTTALNGPRSTFIALCITSMMNRAAPIHPPVISVTSAARAVAPRHKMPVTKVAVIGAPM